MMLHVGEIIACFLFFLSAIIMYLSTRTGIGQLLDAKENMLEVIGTFSLLWGFSIFFKSLGGSFEFVRHATQFVAMALLVGAVIIDYGARSKGGRR